MFEQRIIAGHVLHTLERGKRPVYGDEVMACGRWRIVGKRVS
jgi:hypothetical protein